MQLNTIWFVYNSCWFLIPKKKFLLVMSCQHMAYLAAPEVTIWLILFGVKHPMQLGPEKVVVLQWMR